MDKAEILKSIFESDTLGLLTLKPKASKRTADDRLVSAFQVILDFYEENSREPEKVNDMQECKLFYELKGLRENQQKKEALKAYDVYGLLDIEPIKEVPVEEPKEYNSINDILSDDSFGILNTDNSIFTLTHITNNKDKNKTDFVAKRKPCKDFKNYETIFKECHKNLKEGQRKLVKFSEDHIKKGTFFVVDGMLAYVDIANEIKRGKHSKLDGRIRCIFENGTESNLLFRSLGKALYKNGESVSEVINNTDLILTHIDDKDEESGFIYILKSKSANPQIQAVPNLYKIGFSTTPVEERIKNATQDPTYLMAEVQLIVSYKCYNLNPQKFENLIHTFFGKVCLAIDIFDNNQKRHTPREWFLVPLNIVEDTIQLLISGGIVKHKYDDEKEIIYAI
jgi:hypothetical protein